MMTVDDHWWTRARCLGEDPEQFFTIGHVPPHAMALCTSCPVRVQCLTDALAVEAATGGRRYGLRGGMTSVQRGALR